MSFSEAFGAALRLLAGLDPDVFSAVSVSLWVSSLATLLASLMGVPVGLCVAMREFRGRRVVEVFLNTLTALPTVVVGLLTYAILSRRGLSGGLGRRGAPWRVVAGRTVLVSPLGGALPAAVVIGADPRIGEAARTLGASQARATCAVLLEMRRGIVVALTTAFGRLIAELGVALIVGGNIRGTTRTMTTAIALETSKGEFAVALALGFILLGVALIVNAGVGMLAPARWR